MLKPNGLSTQNIDPLYLLDLWAHQIDQEFQEMGKSCMIFAAIGKPTYPLNQDIAVAATRYWQEVGQLSKPIGYGDPSGQLEAKRVMAQGLSVWYEQQIVPEDLIFTVGGLSALKMIFSMVNKRKPNGFIITLRPYYPYYNNDIHNSSFYFIDVMKESGYRLTAHVLQETINQATNDGIAITAFLFCDPNNPLGSTMTQEEWREIGTILKSTSADIPIIIDEAYAEMVFAQKHRSLLRVVPELKNRLILLRSATKAFSASGERMAIMICFNEKWRSGLADELSLSYLHAPKSLQYAYAHAIASFSDKKREALTSYYQEQVLLAQSRLKSMEAQMPDKNYTVESTFYVLANLSDLLGSKIPQEAAYVLGKTGQMVTDEDICYSLLFSDQIMIAPLSYFGADPRKGFVRITCSGGIDEINELMNRIERRLLAVRKR